MLNALLYRRKNGCSWRDPPGEFGNWHVIYVRFSRWVQNGVLQRVYTALLEEEEFQNADIRALDSTSAKVHPDAFGCLKKRQTVNRQVPRRMEINFQKNSKNFNHGGHGVTRREEEFPPVEHTGILKLRIAVT